MADFVGRIVSAGISGGLDRDRPGSYVPEFNARDEVAPIISNLSPAALSEVQTLTPISFDLTDEGLAGTAFEIVWVEYANGTTEVIFDGTAFSTGFSTSTRDAITGGHSYVIRRIGGWSQSFSLKWAAVDFGGNVSA